MQTEDRKTQTLNTIFIFIFCAFLFCVFILNIKSLWEIISQKEISIETWKQTSTTIESEWKNEIVYRNQLIDLYGISLLAFHKDMVGNFEFVKDADGIIQRFEPEPNTQEFEASIIELKQWLESNDIPLVYIQLPDKSASLAMSKQFYFSGQRSDSLYESLSKNGVDILDIETIMTTDPKAPLKDDFFFRTDVHLSTYAEFWMSRHLVQYLSENYGIHFETADQVFDQNQYVVSQYEFLGNTARSAGRFFTGTDCFELYIPRFETDMALIDKVGNQTRAGTFQTVVMNGYENRETIDLYTYWITDYGQYPQPYYQYQNNLNPNAPRLLIIADSLFMRGISFLSLACSNVTVVDTRFMQGVPYVEQALAERSYDAVIVCGSSASFLQSSFTVETTLPDVQQRPAQTADYWIARQGLCIDSYNGTRIGGDATGFQIDRSSQQISLVGWAADFAALQPLSALYLQVGDQIVKCNYGIERTSVSDHFQNIDLKDTGFSVTFPASYLEDGQVEEIRFIQIGADGTYCYEPITYQLGYT